MKLPRLTSFSTFGAPEYHLIIKFKPFHFEIMIGKFGIEIEVN